ncbi:MAG: hypothetical protein KJZ86_21560, partial [Caldilineaceae bacterium]|nr:hypothetical protein [Caldilineaceae bacterium]
MGDAPSSPSSGAASSGALAALGEEGVGDVWWASVLAAHRRRQSKTRVKLHRQTPLSQPDPQTTPVIAPAGRGAGGEGRHLLR